MQIQTETPSGQTKTSSSIPEFNWWKKSAHEVVPAEIVAMVAKIQSEAKSSVDVGQYNQASRRKVAKIYRGFAGYWLANVIAATAWSWAFPLTESLNSPLNILALVAILLPVLGFHLYSISRLGKFYIPVIRAFMHAQMHWNFGSSKFHNLVLNHGISTIFSLPQTQYVVGHRLHHRFDNDWSPDGFPKDAQSTFMFSKNAKPLNMRLWVPYYMFGFQLLVAPYLTFRYGKRSEKISVVFETLLVVLFHFLMYQSSSIFYFFVYLPALFVAWYMVACALYMQHDVRADAYQLHPSNNCLSKSFNSFCANDGYHLEHSLFPQVHPFYLPKIHAALQVPAEQLIHIPYAYYGMKKMRRGG